MPKATIAKLRAASEDDVQRALTDAYIRFPIANEAEALELFNRMVDVVLENAAEN